MKKQHLDFNIWIKDKLKDPEFKAEYNRQEPEFAVIRAILKARMKKGLTQKELAEKIGTRQSAIARLESGNANPSIGFLQKVAEALDTNLQINFVKST